MNGAPVTLKHVRRVYDGDVLAVQDLSLDIQAGQFTTILGPSGSGKTTTLMMIAGFEVPDAGEIWIGDEAVTRMPPHKRNIGMVFQNYALFPHMTVAENVAYPLKMRRWSKREIQAAVGAALDLVRLAGYEGRMPRQLSGGQQQRVALARATVFQPPLLLMDEPLGALDRKLRHAMQFELKRIQSVLGVTVVSVTHDQEEALTMSDRIVVMDKGRVAQEGTPQDVYERPRSAFVADFIGEANILEGVIETSSSGELVFRLNASVAFPLASSLQLKAGEPRTVAIRPERIEVVPTGRRDETAGYEVSGRIVEFTYAGDIIRMEVKVGDQELIAKAPSGALQIDPKRGLPVALRWTPEAVVLLSA